MIPDDFHPHADLAATAGPHPRDRLGASLRAPELTIVVPTFNERVNIVPLIERLQAVLVGIAWETIFVDDDSRDGTAAVVRDIARRDRRIRCIQRIRRRGLAGACIEGILASSAPFIAVMDADLQHDEVILPQMLATLRDEGCDLVVGSRYVAGGGVGDWMAHRRRASSLATWLAHLLTKSDIADPMSGFFMLRRSIFEDVMHGLSTQGFKILLDILATADRPLRVRELPYQFRRRVAGESKLDAMVAWEFVMLLADKLIGHIVPVRFALFALIGSLGLLVHMSVLATGLKIFSLPFIGAQTLAALVAMTGNFLLNNFFTYADRRLKGRNVLRGLLSFYLICSFGAVANIGIAAYLFSQEQGWWLAGIAGIIVGSVWNYAVSSVFTWQKP